MEEAAERSEQEAAPTQQTALAVRQASWEEEQRTTRSRCRRTKRQLNRTRVRQSCQPEMRQQLTQTNSESRLVGQLLDRIPAHDSSDETASTAQVLQTSEEAVSGKEVEEAEELAGNDGESAATAVEPMNGTDVAISLSQTRPTHVIGEEEDTPVSESKEESQDTKESAVDVAVSTVASEQKAMEEGAEKLAADGGSAITATSEERQGVVVAATGESSELRREGWEVVNIEEADTEEDDEAARQARIMRFRRLLSLLTSSLSRSSDRTRPHSASHSRQ